MKQGFEPIQFSTWQALTDGWVSCLCPCSRAAKRVKLVETCQEKFEDDLDISNLLRKVNECNALLEKLKNSEIE
eukprot:CAMPEP_0170504610 /NCGR_PEP_ID=MMETSP0208-20121228/48417_1 /TAXON_ID=197538 /ORGANISM="Strombidium inclinatum, Strain S3" /LENGTH=73 /DNA_ID=CAMNT_0010784965 /DNA_START=112 /DNA_END=330 /DNA_ORIENTATION=-